MKIRENIALSESGFVFDSNTGDSYNLNSVGQDVMRLMKEGKNLEEVLHAMLEEYDVEADTLESAIYDFVSMLRQFNLLENEK